MTEEYGADAKAEEEAEAEAMAYTYVAVLKKLWRRGKWKNIIEWAE